MSELREEGRVVWSTPAGDGDTEIEALLRLLESRLERPDPYVVVFDLTRMSAPTARQRQALAAHMRNNRGRIRRRVMGLGVVAPSAVVRGVVTAIFWLEPAPVPHRVFSSVDEASGWARTIAAGA